MGIFAALADLFNSGSSSPAGQVEFKSTTDLLSELVVGKSSLITEAVLTDAQQEELSELNRYLALMEHLTETPPADALSSLLQTIDSAEPDEKIDLLGEIRERPEEVLNTLLEVILVRDPVPEVRKAAASALLYREDDVAARALVQQSFMREDIGSPVREVAIYALTPDTDESHLRTLVDSFAGFSPRLRRSAMELLRPLRDRSDQVRQLLESTGILTDEDRKYLARL